MVTLIARSMTTRNKNKKNEKTGLLSDDSYDSHEDENDLSMTTGNETMASLRAELNSLRQIHDASERRANNYAERVLNPLNSREIQRSMN